MIPFWTTVLLDLAADDHAGGRAFWTVLRDPGGLRYCVTGRDPFTGDVSA
ncbi:MAG: hypothetical protein OSB43_01505 [Nocardioides sp.]|nr:hypothetical protein [Nocardioides sp.]MDE0774937.1 hypothetical protein [Nocardioides sp.]